MAQVKHIRCLSPLCPWKKQVSGQPEADRLARNHRDATAKSVTNGGIRHQDFLFIQATEVHV